MPRRTAARIAQDDARLKAEVDYLLGRGPDPLGQEILERTNNEKETN